MGNMKTFGGIKKGDKIYVVDTGTVIPGGVEIIEHEALSDYTDELPYHDTTLFGVLISNPFGGEIPLCFNAEDTSSGMYYTTIEEAKQKAIETADKTIKEYEDKIFTKINEIFSIHQQIVLANVKKQSWM